MSLIVSAYDGDDKGNENRVCFWLRLDAWHLQEAAMVLVDIDPDTIQLHKDNLFGLKSFQGDDYSSADDFSDYVPFWDSELAIYQRKYDDMRRILYNLDDIEYDTPSYWIERAIAKKVNIPWLEFAIRKGFYVPKNEPANKQEAEKPLADKERGNLYRIIAALSETLLNENSSDETKPHLKNQSKLIEHLDHRYVGYAGLKKSNLETVLAAAKKLLNPS